jgi:hypothetical protein
LQEGIKHGGLREALQRKRAQKTVSSEDCRLKPEELKGADHFLTWDRVTA